MFIKSKSLFLLLILFTAGFLSCAHQGSPGGGPIDTTPPEVESTAPHYGQTDINTGSRVVLHFSKWIAPASALRSVTIYPTIEGGFKVDVSGRRLSIVPSSPLRDSTTYHVVIDASLQDLRSNSLEETFNLVFATGPNLDSVSLQGCVTGAPFSTRPKIALFSSGSNWHDSLYFSAPDYLTGADSLGNFSFSHLRAGKYRLVAFQDRNNDGKLQPAEACYTPLDSVIHLGESDYSFAELYRSDADTLPLKVSNVRALSANVLRGTWNKPFEAENEYEIEWIVKPTVDTVDAPVIDGFHNLGRSTGFVLMLVEPMQNVPYHLVYTIDENRDSLRFNGSTLGDTVAPALRSFSPQSNVELEPLLRLIWSEPVFTDSMALVLASEDDDTVGLNFPAGIADTLVVKTSRRLRPDTEYSLMISAKGVQDPAGNTLSDTALVDGILELTINTIAADSLAFRLHGSSPCLKPDPQRRWIFRPSGSGRTYLSDDHDGFFVFDSIPAANGTVGWFIDKNQNDRPDSGRLIPWRAPEPYVMFTDTVEARARWEVDNVVVGSDCELCGLGRGFGDGQ